MKYKELISICFIYGEHKKLSTSARICLLSLVNYWADKGYPKTFKMPLVAISAQIGASNPTSLKAINELEKHKAIEVKRGGPRVPNTLKVMLSFIVKELNVSGVMLSCFNKETLPYIYTNNTNTNTNKINRINKPSKPVNNVTVNGTQPANRSNGKKLSIWHLKQIKDVCEQELNELRINGYEDAWGFQWAKEDKPKVKELKSKLKNINRQIMESS